MCKPQTVLITCHVFPSHTRTEVFINFKYLYTSCLPGGIFVRGLPFLRSRQRVAATKTRTRNKGIRRRRKRRKRTRKATRNADGGEECSLNRFLTSARRSRSGSRDKRRKRSRSKDRRRSRSRQALPQRFVVLLTYFGRRRSDRRSDRRSSRRSRSRHLPKFVVEIT